MSCGIVFMNEEENQIKRIAQKTDWETQPMPETATKLEYNRVFTKEQIAFLTKGHIPKDMDDRWFWFYEEDKLYIHRSWTGICVYIIEFNTDTNIHKVMVNLNPEEYPDIESEIKNLDFLFDRWLHMFLS